MTVEKERKKCFICAYGLEVGLEVHLRLSMRGFIFTYKSLILFGAGDRARTGDVQLGKLTFYH